MHVLHTTTTFKTIQDERKCYFNIDNHNLQDFTKYTEANCQSECQAFKIYNECKCIPLALSGMFYFLNS